MRRRQFLSSLFGASWTLSHLAKDAIMLSHSSSGAPGSNGRESITLGGGCFWCVEAVYEELKGVERAESGYSGGNAANPSYREVSTGNTGHVEVVQVSFDPKVISLKEILEIFFHVHDPTTLNRQGADVGTQYRSAIFYTNAEQKKVAEQVIQATTAAKLWPDPILTEVSPLKEFYKAEDYHQEYFKLNGTQPYCRAVIAPKMSKFRKEYKDRLKTR